MQPDVVVFDVGNVLIDWNARYLFRQLLPDDGAIDRFFAKTDFFNWNLEQDRGRSFADGVADFAWRHPDHAHLARAFDARWNETVSGPIDGAVAILERLRAAGAPLYAITNFSAEKWDDCRARFEFLDDFRDVVVSAHERVVKPDPAIYHILLRRNDLVADRCVFIDDSEKNVIGARAVGMTALHFTGPAKLADDLRALGFSV